MTEKKELDPLKVVVFIGIMAFFAIFFTADDLTIIGEFLDPVEYIIAMLIGAGFVGKVGFWKTLTDTKQRMLQEQRPVEHHQRKEAARPKDESDVKDVAGKKDIIVKGTVVPEGNTEEVLKEDRTPERKKFKKCPFCGHGLDFTKTPRYCPYCEEEIEEDA